MEAVFLKIINMSINASWLILFVCLLRPLLKKAPKGISCVLWAFVGLRLVCPFSIESVLSLIPSAETLPQNITQTDSPIIDSGIPVIDNSVNEMIGESLAPAVGDSVNPMQILTSAGAAIWLAGIIAMVLYGVISYVRLKLKVRASVRSKDNIYICDSINTPFILGFIKPRIYLPSGLDEDKAEHVIAHERAHLKRGDHLWKPLGFALLCVYWFNPAVWIAYILLCRDIELACDERVIKDMEDSSKVTYSEVLLSCAVNRRTIMVCPLAFGEVNVKSRVKSVLNYKKPAFWIILVSVLLCTAAAVFFLTDPVKEENISVKVNNKLYKERITVGELENKYGYDIYFKGIESVSLKIDGKWIDFKQALIDDIITPEQLLALAYKDSEKGYCKFDIISDGGSTTYRYPTFTIHKQNSMLIDESKDITVYSVIPYDAENKSEVRTVLNESIISEKITVGELENKYGYDIYFNGIESVSVKIDDKWMDFKQALINDTITPEKLLELADNDAESGYCGYNKYLDGGTVTYLYNSFRITKYNSLGGKKDMIIDKYGILNPEGNTQGNSSTVPETGGSEIYGNLPITYSNFDAMDYTVVPVPDTGESVSFVQWDYSGMGFSSKTVTGGFAALITQEISNMKDSSRTSPEISSLDFENYGNSPAERGTLWLEWKDRLYRINPDRNEICRVDRHYGQGDILNAGETFFDLINDAWYYSGFNYYYGKIVDGVMIISHKYREYCDVDMTVTALTLTTDRINNSITLLLTAKKDLTAQVDLVSQHSDDLFFDFTGSDELSLKANKPQEVTISFDGEAERSFYITLTCGGTRIVLYT